MGKEYRFDWNFYQENSDKILADGIWLLCHSATVMNLSKLPSSPGVYLISHAGDDYYIGQADNLKTRCNQQFSTRSTFYKNYQEKKDANQPLAKREDFKLRVLVTTIGRKELEEFGMVNLKTPLNKFHKNKRKLYSIKSGSGLWESVQSQANTILDLGESKLLSCNSFPWNHVNLSATPGIYLVFDIDENLIYVGESSVVGRRHRMHSQRTYISALRRHVGTEILDYSFTGKNKFTDIDDLAVTNYLKDCSFAWMPVTFGRLELEEMMIRKLQPLLNRKSKKNSPRLEHPSA